MADDEPRTGELTTANYGWTKPNVGNSDDAWGGMLNSDLDAIDSVVHGIDTRAIPGPSSSQPVMDGTASAGSATAWSRGDHVHPTDTSKYDTTNPAGYQTAAQVNASLLPYALVSSVPAASATAPVMDSVANAGSSAAFSRGDHVHPTDTTRYAASNPAGYQTAAQVTTALAPYAPLASPALTGNPTAPTPTAGDNDTSVATTSFVTTAIAAQPVAMGDNRIINGDMRIDQRNGGASGTAFGYTVDRWAYYASQTAKGTWQRQASGLTAFPYTLNFKSASAYTALATDNFGIWQPIEADMVSDFAWGTASAQPVTLSFWVWASKTGMFSGALQNTAETRNYPFTFNISTASTWTMIVVTIPGDTTGTWVLSGNGVGIYLIFDLGSGANFRGSAGAWATTSGSVYYVGATGAQSIVATNGATFNLTGVKLEIGSVATPFNRQSLAKSMADCQRYYNAQLQMYISQNNSSASTNFAQTFTVPPMRAAPTITLANTTYSNSSGLTTSLIQINSFRAVAVATAAGATFAASDYLLSAEL